MSKYILLILWLLLIAVRLDIQHSLKRKLGGSCGFTVNSDPVSDLSRDNIVKGPEQVSRLDPVHGGAQTLKGRQGVDLLVRELFAKTIDQVDLGADRPAGSGS